MRAPPSPPHHPTTVRLQAVEPAAAVGFATAAPAPLRRRRLRSRGPRPRGNPFCPLTRRLTPPLAGAGDALEPPEPSSDFPSPSVLLCVDLAGVIWSFHMGG